MTVAMLRDAGVDVDDTRPTGGGSPPAQSPRGTGSSSPTCPTPCRSWPPRSSAAGSSGYGWPQVSTQPADTILAILEKLGSIVRHSSSYLEVQGAAVYGGFNVDLHDVGELTPAVAALAALACPGSVSQLPGSPICAATRPTGWRHSAPKSTASVADAPKPPRPGDHRAAAAGGVWRLLRRHRMATAGASSGCGCPASRWRTSARRPRRCLIFAVWAAMLAGRVALSSPGYDESDVRVRPGRGSRPRTKTRPDHADAQEGMVVTVNRGRWGCALGRDPHREMAMRARELGRTWIVQ